MINPKLEGKKDQLEAVERLRANEDFQRVMIPHFLERATHHAQQCRNKDLTMDKRAEHIEAAELAQNLVGHLDQLAKSLRSTVEQIKEGRK